MSCSAYRMLRTSASTSILALTLLAVRANAQTAPPTGGGHPITLAECRALVVANNLSLLGQQLEWEASKRALRSEKGIYEPEFVATGERVLNKRENSIEQTLSQDTSLFYEKNWNYGAAIEKLFASGAKVRLGYTLQDISNNLRTNVVDTVRHEYQGFSGLSFTQPLLRNAGVAVTESRIRLARHEADIAFEGWRKQLMTVLAQSEGAYWDLQQAQELVGLREKSLQIAQAILDDNRERVRAGKMAELEVLQAEAGVAMRGVAAADARQKVVEAMNRLKTFFTEVVSVSNRTITAVDRPAVVPVALDFNELAERALRHFPDYRIGLARADQEDVRVVYAENQRWPQLDLTGSYGLNGLGADWADSWDQTRDHGHESWSVGLELRIPLGGGTRSANELAAARLRKRQALMSLKATEVTLINTLDAAISKIKSSEGRVKGYELSVDVNQQLFETERQRLDAGKSDSRKVLEIEEDLVAACIGAAESLVQYRKAVSELEYTSGTMLAKHGFELDRSSAIQ